MVLFIRIEKDNKIKEEKIDDIKDLYKKCGLRKPDGVDIIDSKYNKELDIEISLYGRTTGRANIKSSFLYESQDNKSINIYGTCAFLGKKNDILVDLTEEMWNFFQKNNEIKDSNSNSNNELKSHPNSNNELKSHPNIELKPDPNNNSDDESDLDSVSDQSFESNDSELQKEEYLYSSEDEI